MSATVCARCSRQQHDLCTTAVCSCAKGKHRRLVTAELEAQQADPAGGLVWEDPPAVGSRGRKSIPPITAEQLAELEEHPGQWARVRTWTSRTSANSARTRILKERYAHLDPKHIELTAGVVGDGSALWARWIADALSELEAATS